MLVSRGRARPVDRGPDVRARRPRRLPDREIL